MVAQLGRPAPVPSPNVARITPHMNRAQRRAAEKRARCGVTRATYRLKPLGSSAAVSKRCLSSKFLGWPTKLFYSAEAVDTIDGNRAIRVDQMHVLQPI